MSSAFLIAIVVIVAAAVAPTLATEHVVGDGAGWTVGGPNYADWARGHDFRVGDTLRFSYTIGLHNVLEVSRADAEGCTSSDPAAFPYMTGNDSVSLTSPGEKWYICDLGDHCLKGMKLGITVSAPPPSAVTVPSAVGEVSCGWMHLLMAAYCYWMNMIM
ncbi:mavicyanin-like [Salvia miltiorrhiza]|uniref:mavicyanin-like n=1 Tax=Salvia miltiorrhiza TaxID=226208 RepID=UPI0025ACFC1E|nr:mavicyanin-like [Salvia miltiorrhiza]